MKIVNLNWLAGFMLISATVTTLIGCSADNPPITGPQRQPGAKIDREVVESTKDGLTVSFDPRVDIVFIMDDSESMMSHQANFSRNVYRFVDGFAKDETSPVDFHIGFTFVHDRSRYGSIVPEVCPANTTTPGRVNWMPPGSLQVLKGLPDTNRRYVTKQDDFRKILGDSLDPKKNDTLIKRFTPIAGDPANICPYGPEEEELFTPLLGVLEDPTRAAGPNKGFRRPGAFFVAILMSDAKDSSGLDEVDVVKRVEKAVGEGIHGKKNFRIFSVVMKPGDKIDVRPAGQVSPCKPDPAWADITPDGHVHWDKVNGRQVGEFDNPLANLARLTDDGSLGKDAQILSICSENYGDTLAKYGAKIQEEVYQDIVIELPSRPQITNDPKKILSVYLEGASVKTADHRLKLEQGADGQWTYNPADVTITVYNKSKAHPNGVDWSQFPGAKLHPYWTPVDENSKNAKPL